MWWLSKDTVPTCMVKALSELVPRPWNPLMDWALAVSQGDIDITVSPHVWLLIQRSTTGQAPINAMTTLV